MIRLHAEWLWHQKRYDEIHYNFVNGFRADYTRYANGERIKIDGNNAHWVKTNQEDYSYQVFREYLEKVFEYANTASLEKELIPVADKIKPGDVFIIGGFPGHAVIVTNVEYHTDGLCFRCAQSWMPAQSIEFVQAFPSVKKPLPNEKKTCGISDWMWNDFLEGTMFFEISGYKFYSTNLKRFKNV